ncbi:hypothetical protein ACR3K2_01060 [Cryptosporidium serpentis]
MLISFKFITYIICLILYKSVTNASKLPGARIIGLIQASSETFLTTRVFISGYFDSVQPNSKGHFVFDNIPPGKYILKITSSENRYPIYEILVNEIQSQEGNIFKVTASLYNIESRMADEKILHPVIVTPIYSVYNNEEQGNILTTIMGLLKNPLSIISIISLFVAFILPKLQEGLDAETMEELTGNIPGGDYRSKFLSNISM